MNTSQQTRPINQKKTMEAKEMVGKEVDKELQNKRIDFWTAAWINVATAVNCRTSDVATIWADKALKDFDERFSKNLKSPQKQ